MATAYAALVSVKHVIEQIQDHPHPPLNLDKNLVESLCEKINFFLDFFELHNTFDDRNFESRIAETAHKAADLIESSIIDQILNHKSVDSTTVNHHVYLSVRKAIQDMDRFKKEATGLVGNDEHKMLLSSSRSSIAAIEENPIVVGLDDALTTIMEKLTQRYESDRRIVTISGMGGIGKTTLARKLYEHKYMAYHFDIRSWATISKNYSVKEILIDIISHLKFLEGGDDLHQMSINDLGLKLYQCLSGRRYLVILDDMWDVVAWDKVQSFFPASNGSGVVITTRELNVLSLGFYCYRMKLLDEHESWDLFRGKLFGKEDYCPPELEEIGINISKNCKGLPLSLVVIGGHLAKSPRTQEYWLYIAKKLNPLVELEDYNRCLEILSLSYENLPIHLKPCFLYMGTFREDEKIRVSGVIKLWVAEGFLKVIDGKSPEETAEYYIKDLIGRNLISTDKLRPTGKIKYCKIHDLLRDFCLKEARVKKFLYVTEDRELKSLQEIENQRRIVVHASKDEEEHHHHRDHGPMILHKATLLQSLIFHGSLPSLNSFKLLRILRSAYKRQGHPEIYDVKLDFINELVSLRHIDVSQLTFHPLSIPSSINLLWNLQTLIVQGSLEDTKVPPEFWKMHQLRHVDIFSLHLPDPPKEDDHILKNLLSLKEIVNFTCRHEAVKRIPNIKKLRIYYSDHEDHTGLGLESYGLHNISRLDKLESFTCSPVEVENPMILLKDIAFPHSLKKLSISHLTWEDVTTKIGSLPLLEVLTLVNCLGSEWELIEEQFSRLKFLQLVSCPELECFAADNRHFKCLERLDFVELYELREISSDIGDISTLKLVKVICCSDSAAICAKELAEMQDEMENEELRVQVQLMDGSELTEEDLSSDSHNFHVILVN